MEYIRKILLRPAWPFTSAVDAYFKFWPGVHCDDDE